MSVIGVVTTSSPGARPSAAIAPCIAAEPEAQATAWRRPTAWAKACSKRGTKVPRVEFSVPLRSARATISHSSDPSVRPVKSPSLGSSSCRGGEDSESASCSAIALAAAVIGEPRSGGQGDCQSRLSVSAIASARAAARASGPATWLAPQSTVSGCAVEVAVVTHGMRSAHAASWTRAESVTTTRAVARVSKSVTFCTVSACR